MDLSREFPLREHIRRCGNKGYTLIQVLVSIGIAGVLLAAASPDIGSVMRTYSVRSGARQVYSDLQNARMLAVMGNQSCTFTLNDGTSYTVQPAAGTPVTTTLDAASRGVTISAPNAITFASNGTASSTATVTVNSTGGSMQVDVSPAGRVRVQ
jgi:Tfp pilus assembly protein FimT